MRFFFITALAALLGTAPGCSSDSPTGSSTLSGTFDLSTVDGGALPHFIWRTEPGDSLFVTGGEVRVLSRGRASIVQRRRWHTPSGGPQAEDSDTLVLTYRENGSTILIDYPTYTDTGTIAGSTLAVRTLVNLGQGIAFHRTLLYYQR